MVSTIHDNRRSAQLAAVRAYIGVWIGQFVAMMWKEAMAALRRPVGRILQLIVPAIVVAILAAGALISPRFAVPAFEYAGPGSAGTLPGTFPDPFAPADSALDAAGALAALGSAVSAFDAALDSAYSARLLDGTVVSANATLAAADPALLYTDTAAAQPFLLGGLPAYLRFVQAERRRLGRAGFKRALTTNPYIWHLFAGGSLVFAPASSEVDALVGWLLNTTGPVLQRLIQPYHSDAFATGKGFGFPFAPRSSAGIWAVVTVNSATGDGSGRSGAFDFTIMMNDTMVPPTAQTHSVYPRGVGQAYARYMTFGFTALQRTLNDYGARLVRSLVAAASNTMPPPSPDPLALLPLLQATCRVGGPADAMYVQPPAGSQADLVAAVRTLPPVVTVSTTPADIFAANAPCAVERQRLCSNVSTDADVASCLYASGTQGLVGRACANAIDLTKDATCFASVQQQCNLSSIAAFLEGGRAGATPTVQCYLRSLPSSCLDRPFTQLMAMTTTSMPDLCANDIRKDCSHTGPGCDLDGCYGPLQCLAYPGRSLEPLCGAAVRALPSCRDEFLSICPFNIHGQPNAFPFACLHTNRDIISATCASSALFTDFVEWVYGDTIATVSAAQGDVACQQATLVDGVAGSRALAAVAMPAPASEQLPFFVNVGPLAGITVAVAFTHPFTAHVRRIVDERAAGRRRYLLSIGVLHSVLIAADLCAGFLAILAPGLFVTMAVETMLPRVPAGAVFGLILTFSMAASSFASFVAALFTQSRTANGVAPMLLFLSALPAFVQFNGLRRLQYFLPASVLAEGINECSRFAQSATPTHVLRARVASDSGILFALCLFYGFLAVILEQLRFSSAGFGCFGNALRRLRQAFSGATRVVVRPLKGTRVYDRLATGAYAAADVDDAEAERERSRVRQAEAADEDEHERTARQQAESLTADNAVMTPCNAEAQDVVVGGRQVHGGQETAHSGGADRAEQSRHGTDDHAVPFVEFADTTYVSTRLHDDRRALAAGVSGVFYRNRINAVVGPAGAGKSAICALAAGVIAPTAGACLIDGRDSRSFARRNVGLAPQRDVLWDFLTVAEHVSFVQMLKCGALTVGHEAASERMTLFETLGLDATDQTWATDLTPGVLRRLSVAMAFAGGSQLVVLDEPTAGVCPVGKQGVWKLLGENMAGRCIVVATTDIPDAEQTHHILLMHRGQLKASGSPQFLKARLGGGSVIVSVTRGAHCKPRQLAERVAALCPQSRLINNVGNELCFRVHAADFHAVPALLTELEAAVGTNDVTSVSVSDGRLDELFMVVVREFDAATGEAQCTATEDGSNTAADAPPLAGSDDNLNGGGMSETSARGVARRQRVAAARAAIDATTPDPHWLEATASVARGEEADTRIRGPALHWRAFLAMLTLRVSMLTHNWFVTLFEFLIPLICVSYAVDIMTIRLDRQPSLTLDMGLYAPTVVFYSDELRRPLTPPLEGLAGVPVYRNPVAETALALSQELGRRGFEEGYVGALAVNSTYLTVAGQAAWRAALLLHNTSALHAIPAMVALWDQDTGRRLANLTALALICRSLPLPPGDGTIPSPTSERGVLTIIGAAIVLVPFAFFPGIFAGVAVNERFSGALDALTASGLAHAVYWLATFVWYSLRFAFFALVALVLFAVSDQSVIPSGVPTGQAFGLLLLYTWCATAMAFLIARAFRCPLTAQSFVTSVNVVFGLVFVVTVSAVDLLPPGPASDEAKAAVESKRLFFRIIPAYALGEGFIKIVAATSQGADEHRRWAFAALQPMLLALGMLFPTYLGALMLYDGCLSMHCLRGARALGLALRRLTSPRSLPPWEGPQADVAGCVAVERAKGPCCDGIAVSDAYVAYHKHGRTIKPLSAATVNVLPGDRLAVLGDSGSGKTTLLRVMNGTLTPHHGDVRLKMRSLTTDTLSHADGRSLTGIASERPGLVEGATPYMLMHVVAELRGMAPDKRRDGHVLHLLHTLGLLAVATRRCAQLSASQRRRVAVGVALVAFPPLIILDEPSSGIDPMGRRLLWAAQSLVPSRSALVVSTHFAEEADMAANRVLLLSEGYMAYAADTTDAARQVTIELRIRLTVRTRVAPVGVAPEDAGLRDDIVEHVFRCFPAAIRRDDLNASDVAFSIPTTAPEGAFHHHQQQQQRPHAPSPPPAAAATTAREVYERMHQKRVELMLGGVHGESLSAQPPGARGTIAVILGTDTPAPSEAAAGAVEAGADREGQAPQAEHALPFDMSVCIRSADAALTAATTGARLRNNARLVNTSARVEVVGRE